MKLNQRMEIDPSPEEKERQERTQKLVYSFVNITMWASVIIIGILIATAPSEVPDGAPEYVHPKAYYTLMFTESILGVICMNLPSKVEKNLKIRIPSGILIPFEIFLYCAIFLGETRSFYYNVPHWDTFLHFFSAGMLGTLAFSIISILNDSEHVPFNLSPGFIALFAFCFAVTCGALWEIYEFTFDGILGLNMQKFMTEDGVPFVGRAALADTMKDIIVDVCGAALVSLFGYFSMRKYTTKWVDNLQLKRAEPKDPPLKEIPMQKESERKEKISEPELTIRSSEKDAKEFIRDFPNAADIPDSEVKKDC